MGIEKGREMLQQLIGDRSWQDVCLFCLIDPESIQALLAGEKKPDVSDLVHLAMFFPDRDPSPLFRAYHEEEE